MSRAVLLVSGSRSLARSVEASGWAKAQIASRLDRLASGGAEVHVLSGGADGPDQWAVELASKRSLSWVAYTPAGWRLSNTSPQRRWSERSVHPLARNEVLVKCALAAVKMGWSALVLGLVDAGSATHGTEHTLGLAKDAELIVERCDWPSGR